MKRDADRMLRRNTRCPVPAAESAHREAARFEAEVRALLNEVESENPYPALAAARDRRAIEDERYFIHRFGFDWPRRDRSALIDLKHRHDVTDRQIRLFKWTGNLKRKGGSVALAATRGSAIYGRCLIVGIFIEFVLLALPGMLTVHHLSALQVAKLCAAAAYVIAMAWGVNLGFVKPWTIQCHALGDNAP